MKRKTLLNTVLAGSALTFMVIAGVSASIFGNKEVEQAKAEDPSSTSVDTIDEINLNDCTEEEIQEYYAPLNSVANPSTELRGENLLKHLKSIIGNNVTYFSFSSSLQKIYTITDRDWENSPASTIKGGHYNSETNMITDFDHSDEVDNNPYLHLLYHDYSIKDKIKYKGEGDVDSGSVSFDKEHAWSQSHGFSESSSSYTGAGSDLHHIKAGTQYGNRTMHSNYSFGFVKNDDTASDAPQVDRKNKRGTPLFTHASDQSGKVFEPQDCDKGDIARALMYMVACYNNLDGSTPTPKMPALKLVNYLISNNNKGYSSDNLQNGYYGILQDILAWHYMDPVDEYEIHRNNLIFRNYQHNRNPFIDYPEWADYIWGRSIYNSSAKTISYDGVSTGYADLELDPVNDYRENVKAIKSFEITKQPTKTVYYDDETFDPTGMEVILTYEDDTTKDVTDLVNISADLTVAGQRTVTVTFKKVSTTTTVTVLERTDPVSSVTLDTNSLTFRAGDYYSLQATVLPRSAANKNLVWTSSDSSIVSVDGNGKICGRDQGSATITATSASDSSKTATCTVTVSGIKYEFSESTYELVKSVDQIDTDRKFVIVASQHERTMGAQETSKRGASDVHKDFEHELLDISSETAIFELEEGYVSDTYAIKDVNESKYLYVDGTGTNYTLKSHDDKGDNESSFSITFDSETNDALIVAKGSETNNYMGFTSPNTFNCYSSQKTGANAIQLYQQVAREGGIDIYVTDITLSKTTLSLNKTETEVLNATIYPGDATNTNYYWESSAPTVATISDEGLVTAGKVGTTIITVTTDDGGISASCTVTVTSQSTGTQYYEKQTSVSAITTGKYVICANVNGEYYPMGKIVGSNKYIESATTITVSEDKISTANAASYVVDLTVDTNGVLIKFDNDKYLSHTSDKNNELYAYDADQATYWVLSYVNTNGSFRLAIGTRALIYRYASTSTRYAAYATSNVSAGGQYHDLELFKYTEGEGTYTTDNFVADFLNNLVCDSTGESEPTFTEGYSWSVLKTKFNSLTSGEKLDLKGYTANVKGDDEAKCVARYDYILSKYGTTKYENFMQRTVVPWGSTALTSLLPMDKDTTRVFIVVIAMISTTSLTALCFIKKKRER